MVLGILATPLPAIASDTPSEDATDTWFITRASTVALKSGPPSSANYPVLVVESGQPLLLGPFEPGDWAPVRLVGPSVAPVRGLLELGPSTLVEDGVAVVEESTLLFAPNQRATVDEGTGVDPDRSWKDVARLAPGARLRVADRFLVDDVEWAFVAPPEDVVLWVNPARLRPAETDEIPDESARISVAERLEDAFVAESASVRIARGGLDLDYQQPGGGMVARPL